MTFYILVLIGLGFLVLAYLGKSYWAWVAAATGCLALWNFSGVAHPVVFCGVLILVAALALLFGFPALRRLLVTKPVMGIMGRAMPRVGKTEEIALKAGTVWWEGELFCGTPDWRKLLAFTIQPLSEAEQAFVDGPTEELCHMLDDWQISQQRDFSPEIWEFFKAKGFFGMIIPREFGGLGFSAAAHSAVVTKVASRSVPAAVTVMVPNSLGAGELILHYGTTEQKEYYLPRLAKGEEIPCFALTEAKAGSDAASGHSRGIVCRDQWQGKEVTGIRLTFKKRYITLAPVATVIGLAFRLFDPQHLLGGQEDIGITCALIPRETEGLQVGMRHDPMNVPFMVGPVEGEDVFVPVDFIIGGKDFAGHGWRMLMENLSAGRGISLPSLSVGAAELACRATSAYGIVREQFGLPIGRFEGIRERLVRVAGFSYLLNATRRLTCGAVDAGEKPSVVSAIAKAYSTEAMRQLLNDSMDIFAGTAICRGPANIFSMPYNAIPIGITVEGANVLTRSLIIFGQGAMRCHPFLQKEVEAATTKNLKAFDRALFGHLNYTVRNGVRAFALAVFGRFLTPTPVHGPEARYYRALGRLSMDFALIADVALVTLGGAVKRKEHLSGRFADALAWMYLASAVLKRFHDEGSNAPSRSLLDWTMTHALHEIENALTGILANLPNRMVARVIKVLAFPLGARHAKPSDRQTEAVANVLLDPANGIRDGLTGEMFIPAPDTAGLGRLEAALGKVLLARTARGKLKDAIKKGLVDKAEESEMAEQARERGILSTDECSLIREAEEARDTVIQVSAFEAEAYFGKKA